MCKARQAERIVWNGFNDYYVRKRFDQSTLWSFCTQYFHFIVLFYKNKWNPKVSNLLNFDNIYFFKIQQLSTLNNIFNPEFHYYIYIKYLYTALFDIV